MLDNVKPVSGRKGGGKGGGSSRTPYEAPDNLLTDSTAYLIDVVSEGEIEGWADSENPGTCIYFDDTPLQNPDGSYNFEGVEYWLRTGTPDQEPVPGFSAVENEVGVSVLVEQQQPVVRSITAADVDAARIKVGVASLSTLNTETGDLTEAKVDFAIEMQAGSGGWETVGSYSISGKTTSGYQRAYRVELPEVRPVAIRVRRITPDSESSNIQNDLFFVSYTEVIDAKLRYPDTAYVALAVPASAFGGRIPRRSYRLKGVKCWVPSNYDPVARTYDETSIWDGTFKHAFTRNPAFLTYTVLLENRWGLGERIAPDLVDKWRIYQIAKYCDELVPDGLGGMEPRFTMNGVMNTREAAYQVITQLSAAFRGVTYWGAGAVVPVQDAPSDPVKIVTNANVVGGAFNYAGTGLSARKTAVVASYRHAEDHFKVKAGLVFEDHDAIQRYGRRQTDATLPFTSSRGEALRTAKWIIDTNLTSKETVNYQAGFDHAAIRPGDKLLISDKHRVGFRVGGRITGVASDRLSVTLDAPVTIEAGESYQLLIATDVGEYVTVDVDAAPGENLSDLALVSALPSGVAAGAIFVLSATDMEPRLFRVVSNTPEKHLFNIVALEDDAEKYDRVEFGINTRDTDPFIIPTNDPVPAPTGMTVQAFVRPDPGSLSKLRILVSWSSSASPFITKYIVWIKEPGTAWSLVGETAESSFEIVPRGDVQGEYQLRVRAVSVIGEMSPFAIETVSVDDVFAHPATPNGWTGTPQAGGVLLSGPASTAPDFRLFEIFAATPTGVELDHIADVSSPYLLRAMAVDDPYTRYKVRERNWAGLSSPFSDWIEVQPGKISPGLLNDAVWDAVAEDATAAASALDEAIISEVIQPLKREVDLRATEQRTVSEAVAIIGDQVLWVTTQLSEVDGKFADAGIVTDPETGKVRIYALEQEAERISEAEIRLSAAEASIALSATQAWVRGQITEALLDPSQLPLVEDLQLQVNAVEVELDAINADLALRASQTEVDGIGARLSTAEADLDAAQTAINLKAEQTQLDVLQGRVQTAEVAISAFDGPQLTQTVADTRYLLAADEEAAEQTLASLLQAHADGERIRQDIAYATEDLRAKVTEDREAFAIRSVQIGASIDNAMALIEQESLARASQGEALAASLNTLTTTVDENTATVQTLSESVDGISGRHMLRVNVNGVATGMVIAAEAGDDGAVSSSVAFAADSFTISAPTGAGAVSPFAFYATPRVINGILFPSGLYIENAFIGHAAIGRGQITDTLQSDNYAETNGRPTAGLKLDFANGQVLAADVVLSRDQVLASGSFGVSGRVYNGQIYRFVNTGIRVSSGDVRSVTEASLVVEAGIRTFSQAGAGFDGNNAWWCAKCEILNGPRWFGFNASRPQPAVSYRRDPPTLITPYWSTGIDQRVWLEIEVVLEGIPWIDNPTFEWIVKQVT